MCRVAYRTSFLARLLVQADLGRPHIVAPDVGTATALFAAAAYPDGIAGVMVASGGAEFRSSSGAAEVMGPRP